MERRILAFARRLVPETAGYSPEQEEHFLAAVRAALDERSPAVRAQLSLFLHALTLAPVARYGRTWDALSPRRQDAVLAFFQDAPLLKLRQGLWGLKILAFMGHYGRPEVAQAIGWRPAKDGGRVSPRG